MMGKHIYGWWIIREIDTDKEVHRVEGHSPEGSPNWDRADEGLMRRIDLERFYTEWVSAQ